MKKNNGNALIILFLSMLVLHAGTTIYGAERLGSKNEIQQIEQGKEVLVDRNTTLEDPVWCGENAFVISNEDLGLRWIDFVEKKVVTINRSSFAGAIACSPDRAWLIYVDSTSVRYDIGTYERGVRDFWRYNFKTGQRQKFAIAQGGGKWSPDGKKFLFQLSKPRSFIEQPTPKWELVFSNRDWSSRGGFEVQWLNDSSSVIINSENKLYIERFNTKEPTKLINIDLGNITQMKVDRFDRIYLISRLISKDKKRFEKVQFLRCVMKDDTLQCEDILKRNNKILRYDITPDGEQIVFLEEGDPCAWHLKIGDPGARCIVKHAEPTVSISPNGKWLAFTRHRKIGKQSGVDIVESDLFVKKLKDK